MVIKKRLIKILQEIITPIRTQKRKTGKNPEKGYEILKMVQKEPGKKTAMGNASRS